MIENLTVGRALEFAITTEQLGQRLYAKLAGAHADDELHDLFTALARDEEVHASQLRALRDDLGETENRELAEQDADYLRTISTAEIFHGYSDPLTAADSMEDRTDALKLAMDLEKSTLLFYHTMEKILGSSPVLDSIIAMEKHHLAQVVKYLISPESKMRGLSDTWT